MNTNPNTEFFAIRKCAITKNTNKKRANGRIYCKICCKISYQITAYGGRVLPLFSTDSPPSLQNIFLLCAFYTSLWALLGAFFFHVAENNYFFTPLLLPLLILRTAESKRKIVGKIGKCSDGKQAHKVILILPRVSGCGLLNSLWKIIQAAFRMLAGVLSYMNEK